jgi:hypothetical protein
MRDGPWQKNSPKRGRCLLAAMATTNSPVAFILTGCDAAAIPVLVFALNSLRVEPKRKGPVEFAADALAPRHAHALRKGDFLLA